MPGYGDFLVASSYGEGKVSSGTIRLLYDPETQYQPPPEPHGAQTRDEPQVDAERQTQDPVPQQVDEHGASGIAHPPEHPRGHNLKSIEDLEHAGDRNQRRRNRDDLEVSAIKTGE